MANFEELKKHLSGEKKSSRIFIGDLFVDESLVKGYCETRLKEEWIRKEDDIRVYCKNKIAVYKDMGFTFVPESHWIQSWIGMPEVSTWINEHSGLIKDRKDFDRFPWDSIEPSLEEHRVLCELLPEGMKIVVESGSFQDILDVIVGYESAFLMIYDEPQLLCEIIDRWFSFKLDFYTMMAKKPQVGAIWHADDLGSKTGLLISPEFVRKNLVPWYKRYSDVIHDADTQFWFHCCGNIYNDGIIEDLIYTVKIDAFHSFQDSILPVQDFLAKYGSDVGVIGGIDVDFLSTGTPEKIKRYVEPILNAAEKSGRYVLGSGNSVTDYVPLENWEAVLEIARLNGRI